MFPLRPRRRYQGIKPSSGRRPDHVARASNTRCGKVLAMCGAFALSFGWSLYVAMGQPNRIVNRNSRDPNQHHHHISACKFPDPEFSELSSHQASKPLPLALPTARLLSSQVKTKASDPVPVRSRGAPPTEDQNPAPRFPGN